MTAGEHSWTVEELQWHTCPTCGHHCPPRPPVHGPSEREVIASFRAVMSELKHSLSCPMTGYSGGHMGHSVGDKLVMCDCFCRVFYRKWYAYEHPPEDEDE